MAFTEPIKTMPTGHSNKKQRANWDVHSQSESSTDGQTIKPNCPCEVSLTALVRKLNNLSLFIRQVARLPGGELVRVLGNLFRLKEGLTLHTCSESVAVVCGRIHVAYYFYNINSHPELADDNLPVEEEGRGDESRQHPDRDYEVSKTRHRATHLK